MTSATDKLRALLDERGVEYQTVGERCVEYANVQIIEYGGSTPGVLVSISHTSPEQAIEATLGRGECEMEPLNAFFTTMNQLDQTAWGVCSNCGAASPIDATYCCECGAKVVER